MAGMFNDRQLPKRGQLTTLRRIWSEILCATVGHLWYRGDREVADVGTPGLPIVSFTGRVHNHCERCRLSITR